MPACLPACTACTGPIWQAPVLCSFHVPCRQAARRSLLRQRPVLWLAGAEGHGPWHEACLPACRVTNMPADIADGDMPLLPKRVHTPPSAPDSFVAEERQDNPQTPVTPSPEGGRLLQR